MTAPACCGEPGCAHDAARPCGAPTERPATPEAACCDHWPLCGGDVSGCSNQTPTVPFARCPCGGAIDSTHRCADPVAAAFAAWLYAEQLEEALAPAERLQLRRQRTAHVNARTAARLAAGPP